MCKNICCWTKYSHLVLDYKALEPYHRLDFKDFEYRENVPDKKIWTLFDFC